jgi:signal transduction histidine kinase
VRTFVSVPVVSHAGTAMGTLCSASRDERALSDTTLAELEVLARLIGDWMVFERELDEQRRRADGAEQALDARAMLIARAEHKLKTPLTLLLGWAQTMEERWTTLEPEQRQEGLAALRRGTVRLHHYVERLLDEARADMLIRRLDAVPVDVGVIASTVAGEVDAITADHVISVVVHPPAAAVGDEEGIRQIIVHLVENAVKYSPEGGAVGVSVATDGDVVVVEVSDEGIGVNDEVDIFAPFVRGVTSSHTPGSGLGLHIVRSFAVAMGGSIEAHRNNDQIGSTFTVRLPASRSSGH